MMFPSSRSHTFIEFYLLDFMIILRKRIVT